MKYYANRETSFFKYITKFEIALRFCKQCAFHQKFKQKYTIAEVNKINKLKSVTFLV